MPKSKSFTFQLIVLGGFIFFFYMFFALATSIYRDYKLESEIQKFEAEINNLADNAYQKPEDVDFFASIEYKDRYAKESLGLLNPGEKLIIIPEEERIIEVGPVELMTEKVIPLSVLSMNNSRQWWEYFFGQTLSVKAPEKVIQEDPFNPESILEGDGEEGEPLDG